MVAQNVPRRADVVVRLGQIEAVGANVQNLNMVHFKIPSEGHRNRGQSDGHVACAHIDVFRTEFRDAHALRRLQQRGRLCMALHRAQRHANSVLALHEVDQALGKQDLTSGPNVWPRESTADSRTRSASSYSCSLSNAQAS